MIKICGDQPKAAITLEELKSKVGETVTLEACVHRVRDMGSIRFFILRTGRFLLQTVYSADEFEGGSVDGIRVGCYVKVTGVVREEPRAVYGLEVSIRSAEVLSTPAEEYPLKVGQRRLDSSLDANLDNRSVALRNPYERATFKFTEGVVSGFREFMLANGFTEIHTPKIVAAGAEGGANIFELNYFDQTAYLNQSPQFYKQTAVAFFDRVFEIGPVFRAERHNTSRHLNEYTGLDFEMMVDSMEDVMEMETAMLRYTVEYLKEHYQNELMILSPELPEIECIPSITFMEAVELLGGRQRADLSPEDEVFLCNYAKENFGSEFIFVTHFPAAKRPFYAMNGKEDGRFALSFDLLFRGLEITTGGQRIHDYNEQLEKMKAMDINPDELKEYLKIHKYGMPPHGGLGIGLERLVMKLLDRGNIREASMFPRDLTRLDP